MKKIAYLYIFLFLGTCLFSCQEKSNLYPSHEVYYPKIELKGSSVVLLKIGETYEDAGFTAKEGTKDVASRVVVSGVDEIDSSVSGAYTVTYSCLNGDGSVEKKVFRNVFVVPDAPSSKENIEGDYSALVKGGETSGCNIKSLGSGIFEVSDLIGGQLMDWGFAKSKIKGYVFLQADNQLALLKTVAFKDVAGASGVAGYFPEEWFFHSGILPVYDPVKKTLTYLIATDSPSLGGVWKRDVQLTKKED